MQKILISQVGNPQKATGNEYRTTTYTYRNKQFKTPMIGAGLAEHFDFDKVLFLGTPGSAWSGVLGMADSSGETLDEQVRLEELENTDAVQNKDIGLLNTFLSQKFTTPVICEVTPYVENDPIPQSIEYLQILAKHIDHGDELTIDVTHGLRFYPMLSIVIAQYLSSIKQVRIRDVVYGNLVRQKDNIAQVQSLSGLLHILDWVNSLNSFDHNGDYGVFASLFAKENLPSTSISALKNANFNERITGATQATKYLETLRKNGFDADKSPLAAFFEPLFFERTDWVTCNTRGGREMALAEKYLAKRDYVRAAIYAQEGYISKGLEMAGAVHDVDDYQARDEYRVFVRTQNVQAFKMLSKLRNAMAHSLKSNERKDFVNILKDESSLAAKIKECIHELKTNQALE